jgi:hypothetical protein
MGQGFVFKGKIVCGDCYEKLADYEIHHERERELPPKQLVEGDNCQRCGAPLAETQE